jgi:hypothetical protein
LPFLNANADLKARIGAVAAERLAQLTDENMGNLI